MTTVVGIDPSLTSTGVVILAEDQVHAHTLTPREEKRKGRLQGVRRLCWIRDQVMALLDCPAMVAIEGPSYGSAQGRQVSIGELHGVLKTAMWEQGYFIVVVPPASLKKFATGKGNASKFDMQKAGIRAGVDFGNEDEVDAYFLARIARALGRPRHEELYTYQVEALGSTTFLPRYEKT